MALSISPLHFRLQSPQFAAAASLDLYEFSSSAAGLLHKLPRKHARSSSATVLCTTHSCFTSASWTVSKICLPSWQSQKRQHDRFSAKCLSSVEADLGIVDGSSLSETVREETLNSPVKSKKTVRTLWLAPKPPMSRILQETPDKSEEKLDLPEVNVILENERELMPPQNLIAFKIPEIPQNERRRWKFQRRAQAEELLLSQMQLQDDEASRTLVALISYVRFVLHVKQHIGERLELKDESLIREKLLRYHPEKEEKLEKGVNFIKVDWHPEHQTRCFFIVRDDFSSIDFSFRKCILQFGQQIVGLDITKRLLDLIFF